MAGVKKDGPRSRTIEALLRYAEELEASRLAYEHVLVSRLSGPVVRDEFDQAIEETRKKADAAFQTLWGYLREQDWQGLQNNVAEELKRLQTDLH